jgi:hypothetical protein
VCVPESWLICVSLDVFGTLDGKTLFAALTLARAAQISRMTKDNWQRLKNLSLFKLWVTDKQLSRYWPIVALIACILLAITAVGYLFGW